MPDGSGGRPRDLRPTGPAPRVRAGAPPLEAVAGKATHRDRIGPYQAPRDAHRDRLLAVQDAELADDVPEVEVRGPRLDVQLDADVDAGHAVGRHFQALRLARRQRRDAHHQRRLAVDQVCHEEIVERHAEQHDLAELARDQPPARFVDGTDAGVDGDQHAPVVRIAKRDCHSARDAVARRVGEEIPALRVTAVLGGVPHERDVAVVGLRDARVHLDVATPSIQDHPFAGQRRPHERARVPACRARIGRHPVHEAVESQLGDDRCHDRLERAVLH